MVLLQQIPKTTFIISAKTKGFQPLLHRYMQRAVILKYLSYAADINQ